MMQILCWIYWDPPREAFTIPIVNHPIAWYGICFAAGFFLSYLLLQFIFTKSLPTYLPDLTPEAASSKARNLLDTLTWYIVLGTIIGARLGHILFYDVAFYWKYPSTIFKIWEGGLASHGGTIGILFALFIFYRIHWKPLMPKSFHFFSFVDLFCIAAPLAGSCIRLGNFINQEIIGTPTTVPWGVVFGHPYEAMAEPFIARHPVQLYEALAYLVIFVFLFAQWWRSRKAPPPPGTRFGWTLFLIFSARFVLEFWKSPQGFLFYSSSLQTGQWLSIPFILIGLGWAMYPSCQSVKKVSGNS